MAKIENFDSLIRRIPADEFIVTLAVFSQEMFLKNIKQSGFGIDDYVKLNFPSNPYYKKIGMEYPKVSLPPWEIPGLQYQSICQSNDDRKYKYWSNKKEELKKEIIGILVHMRRKEVDYKKDEKDKNEERILFWVGGMMA